MNNHLMNNQERIVKWKCPECGNYHKWVWDIYDIFGGEIAMTCDNPECGRTSKMCMVPEKNGNATALVADNSEVEEKLRRATEKVMNSQTEIDISKVLMDGDIVTIMGEKYQRIIEPQSFYDKLWELLDDNLIEWVDTDEMGDRVLNLIMENIPKPIVGGIMEYNAGWNECIRKIHKNIFK
jgi:virulence-associated protein VagC